MKRFHVHVRVADLDTAIAFYSDLFGARPSVAKSDYAKWMLDDPRINFAISQTCGSDTGVEHLGIQVEDEAELAEVCGCLKATKGPVMEEGATICCYARSQKTWIADPNGVVWEAFLTTGDSTVYGESPDFAGLAPDSAADSACCAPQLAAPAQSSCC